MVYFSSTTFHLFGPLSPKVMNFTKRLDYGSVFAIVFSAPYSTIYYTNYSNSWFDFSINFISGLLTITSFVLNLGEWIHKIENYFLKVKLFTSAAFVGIFVPMGSVFLKR